MHMRYNTRCYFSMHSKDADDAGKLAESGMLIWRDVVGRSGDGVLLLWLRNGPAGAARKQR